MTVNANERSESDIANERSVSNIDLQRVNHIFDSMYPALASLSSLNDGPITAVVHSRPLSPSDSRPHVRHLMPGYALSRTPNNEFSVRLPRNSEIRSVQIPMPGSFESPGVRITNDDGSLGQGLLRPVARAQPQGDAAAPASRSSATRQLEDVTPPVEWEVRILSNVVEFVGACLLDFEDFTRGNYNECATMIRRAAELSSLETQEGKDHLLYLCGWPFHYNRCDDADDVRLAAFAVERFRRKHNGPLGDHMAARDYNRYLASTWIIDGVLMWADNNQ